MTHIRLAIGFAFAIVAEAWIICVRSRFDYVSWFLFIPCTVILILQLLLHLTPYYKAAYIFHLFRVSIMITTWGLFLGSWNILDALVDQGEIMCQTCYEIKMQIFDKSKCQSACYLHSKMESLMKFVRMGFFASSFSILTNMALLLFLNSYSG
jgi:hypothetical protein